MMGKIKQLLEEDMMKHPDKYNGVWDLEFWLQCRQEEILEREGKVYKKKVNKNG